MRMEFMLLVVILLSTVTLTVWLPWLWRRYSLFAYALVSIELVAAGLFLYMEVSLWSLLFAGITFYKVLGGLRLIHNRMQTDYLKRVTLRSALILTAAQVLLCLAAGVIEQPGLLNSGILGGIAAMQLIIALILLSSTTRHLRTTKTLQATTSYTDKELPSLSVLIPARNETDDLHACLTALIASNYPKLEIIVLDDCSQNKHTPEIIRSFAHDGVRFIAGAAPNESWLAKNYAYQQLADAASGDYLLFCGVDLRMTPGAIRELITTMLEKDKSMLSILPLNVRPKSLKTLLIQPMRYAWELSLPRRLFNRPPVLSTCWIIKKTILQSAGNFKATSRSIVPESYFARATARQDGYSFLRSNLLVSDKPVSEQHSTAIRMRYPQLHRRLELVWALTVLELAGIVLALPLAIGLFATGQILLGLIAFGAYVISGVVFLQVTGVMYGRPMAWGALLLPVVVLYDVLLLNYSMYRYEFREVNWKDRNVCLPVMRFDAKPIRPTNQV